MNTGNPNQQLAAVWIANVLRDYRTEIAKATKLLDVREAKRIVTESNHRVDDALAQFDAIMGDSLRVAENMAKMPLPFDVGLGL